MESKCVLYRRSNHDKAKAGFKALNTKQTAGEVRRGQTSGKIDFLQQIHILYHVEQSDGCAQAKPCYNVKLRAMQNDCGANLLLLLFLFYEKIINK